MLTLRTLKNKFYKSVYDKYLAISYGVNKKYDEFFIIENKLNIIANNLFSDDVNINKLEGFDNSGITVNNTYVFNSNYPNSAYRHSQVLASDTWIVNHNLGFFPSIPLITTLDNINIDATVENTSINQTIITFSSPKTGFAYFS